MTFVQQHEKDLAKKELSGRELGIIFDGSTRLGEAMRGMLSRMQKEAGI